MSYLCTKECFYKTLGNILQQSTIYHIYKSNLRWCSVARCVNSKCRWANVVIAVAPACMHSWCTSSSSARILWKHMNHYPAAPTNDMLRTNARQENLIVSLQYVMTTDCLYGPACDAAHCCSESRCDHRSPLIVLFHLKPQQLVMEQAAWQTYLKTEHSNELQCRSISVCCSLSDGPSASASLSKRTSRKVCIGT